MGTIVPSSVGSPERPLSAAMRLIAAAADYQIEAVGDLRRRARLREAAGAIDDWTDVLAQANRHRVHGLMARAVADAELDLPEFVASEIKRLARQTVQRSLASCSALAQLQDACRESGIAFAVLKGVPLSLRAYGNIGLRHAKDIDLFVAPDRVEAMSWELERLGYYPTKLKPEDGVGLRTLWYRGRKDLPFRNRKTGLEVELHWRLTNNQHLLDLPFDPDRLTAVTLAPGITVSVLPPEDEFAYLCAHGAAHSWVRLKWLADINALIVRLTANEIDAYCRRAMRLGAGAAVGQALLLCRWIFATQVPGQLLREFCGPWPTRLLGGIALRALARADSRDHGDIPFAALPTALSRLLLGRGSRFWRREIALMAYNPHQFTAFGLPDRLAPLYPFLRPALWCMSQLGLEPRRPGSSRS